MKSNGNKPLTEEEKQLKIASAEHYYGKFMSSLGFEWETDPNASETPHRVAKAWVNDLAEGKRKGSAYADIDLGSYYIVNLNYKTKFDHNSITVSLKNMFDRPYRAAHNFNSPDRSVFVTYSYDY